MVDVTELNAENEKYLRELRYYKDQNRLMKIRTFAFSSGVIIGAYATLYVLKRAKPSPDKDDHK